MKFNGLKIRNFRSIGDEPVILQPWKKCNILIGQNNSGKSNILKAVPKMFNLSGFKLELDRHERKQETPINFEMLYQLESKKDQKLINLIGSEFLTFEFLIGASENNEIKVSESTFANIKEGNIANKLLKSLNESFWGKPPNQNQIRGKFTSKSGLAIYERHIKNSLPEKINLIPEFRKIETGNDYTFGGKNLINLLHDYQHPEIGNDENRGKFIKIQDFIRKLLHLPNALLEIPPGKNTIIINDNDLRLPLESYGTGVHELIIMVTAVLSMKNTLCCIEEPEIHLHPRLQREFLEFLITETSNQYLITTHSPTFINAQNLMSPETGAEIQVFHLFKENNATTGGPVLNEVQAISALNDLGVMPSDLLQANCVIWVEGPSDRIYINHWLTLIDPTLQEGLHYSIMFYGGRLLSHLSVEREEKVPEELIEVLKINQRAIVVIDSDKKKSRDRINSTKARIKKECESNESHCWITYGREIENYIPNQIIINTYNTLFEKEIEFNFDRYDKIEVKLEETIKDNKMKYGATKVKYSKEFISHFEKTDISNELKKELNILVEKIKSWNM